ncbi:MAG TPA: transporter substrate-binding domain-containing protein [Azospirillaceae bacterium]|nr:transporter substrate-binding domain-containing protein [Azospirillaceae bacterium]
MGPLRTWLGLLPVLLAGAATPAIAGPADGAVTIILYSAENGGFAVSGQGTARQFVAAAGARAKLPVIIEGPVPFAEALRNLDEEPRPACLTHVVRTPDREARYWFSPPLEPATRVVAFTRADQATVRAHDSLAGLLSDRSLTLGWRIAASFGARTDAWVKSFQPKTVQTMTDRTTLLQLLERGSIDYFLSAEDLLADRNPVSEAVAQGRVVPLRFKDAPELDTHHLICNDKTPQPFRDAVTAMLADGARR